MSFRALGNSTHDSEFPVACPQKPPQIEDFYGSRNYIRIISEVRNLIVFLYYLALPAFLDILRSKYRIVITGCVSPQIGTLLAILACKIRGIPHIYDYDDLAPEMTLILKTHKRRSYFYNVDLFIESIIVRSSTATIVMSDSMQSIVRHRTGVDVQVIYNAPRAQDFSDIPESTVARSLCNLPQKDFILGYIGNIQLRIRGLETVLEAVALLVKEMPDVSIVLIGDGPGVEFLEDLATSLGVRDNLIITGKTDPLKSLVFLAACDAAIVLTPTDELGAVMAPAKLFLSMGIGQAIIASNTPELRGILGEEGLYVSNQNSVSEILNAIQKAMKVRCEGRTSSSSLITKLHARYVWETNAPIFRSLAARLTVHD